MASRANGSKDALYMNVWRNAFGQALKARASLRQSV